MAIVVCRCLSLLIGACRSSASRSIAAQVTGSGHEFTNAAGSFVGELANSLERESEGKPCRLAFLRMMDPGPCSIVKSENKNRSRLLFCSIILITLSLVRGSPNLVWNDFCVRNGFTNGAKSDPKVPENEVHIEVDF